MKEWRTAPLGEVVTFQRGFDLPQRDRKAGVVPLVSSAGVIDYLSTAVVNPPGVVTGRYGTIGKLFLIDVPFWPLNTTLYVRDFHGNDERFVYYLLQQFDFALFSGKSGVPGVNRNDLHAETVFLPVDIAEQRAIAAALSDVDDLLAGLDRQIAKQRDLKQAAMQQLLSGQTRLPGFTGEWEVKKLGALATIQRGASPRPIDNPIWFDRNSTVGWVRISDATQSGMFLHETTQRLSKLGIQHSRPISNGSLIMSICATVGRPIITAIDACIHDGFVVFDDLRPDKYFMYYVLQFIESDWAKHGQTGSQMNLNTDLINQTHVSLPDIPEQAAIAAVLSDMDAAIAALERRRAKTHDLKQAMMQELLTGKTRLIGPGEPHD